MMNRAVVVVGRVLGIVAVAALATQAPARAQATPQAEFDKVAAAFSAAWAKGDAKAIAALHAKDAVRMSGNGEPAVKGTAAIEQAMTAALTGPFKGSTLSVKANSSTMVTPDIYVGEGTYQITGGTPPAGTPTSGQYMNTMVRQGGRWLIAATAVMPNMQK
jgi:uncharacterized protein (TIGR02246 family)